MNSRLLTWATIAGTFLIAVGMATASVIYVVALRKTRPPPARGLTPRLAA